MGEHASVAAGRSSSPRFALVIRAMPAGCAGRIAFPTGPPGEAPWKDSWARFALRSLSGPCGPPLVSGRGP
eukprot:505541-Pyramimonas_sp.AAC.1